MSHTEWYETAKSEILSRPNAPSAEVIDTVGSVYNTLAHAIAAGADAVEWLTQTLVDGLFLDTASGDALSRLGADRYGVTRHGATSAQVTVSVSRPTYDYGAVTVPAGTIVRTSRGVRFALTGALAFAGTALGPGSVVAVAVEPGVDGNVGAGELVEWETPPLDTTLVVTNAEAAAGGNGEEPDEDYRARIRAAWLAARRGTLEAIRQGALAVAEVREASAFETLDPNGNPSGGVVLTIADAEGNANEAMTTAVSLSLDEYRAAGVGVFPQVAVVRLEDISVTVTWRSGQATAANALAVRQAIIGAVNRLDPRAAPAGSTCEASAKLTVGLIQAAARSVSGVVDVEVETPVGTVVPDPGEVIRTDLAHVEVT